MSSEEITLQNGLNVLQDDPLRTFNCGPAITAPPGPETRELTGFIDDKMFSFPPSEPPEFRSSNIYAAAAAVATTHRQDPANHHHRNRGSRNGGDFTNSGDDESDGDDFDDEEEEDDDSDDDGRDGDENTISNNNINININNHHKNKNKNNSGSETVNNAGNGNPEKVGNGKGKHSFVGESCRELVVKEGGSSVGHGVRESHSYQNAVTIADPDGDIYYAQYLHGGEGSAASADGNGQKDIVVENGGGGGGCGFSGRKHVLFSSDSSDPLRAILSDPVTGALMDDAMILPCGHSFGAAGIQHVIRMKVCYTCLRSVSEESLVPNLSLRAAVQAFLREEDLQFYCSPKRRRERFDQDKSRYGDLNITDPPRSRGIQFPFAVTDRIIIKGNKRTPQRFVGREAVVTTQCLNGWYVVKTLDNAESVKLQYRSLAKVPNGTSSKPMSSKMGPNCL